MPVIVVTRLRLKDPALLDEFFTDAVAAIEQAQKSAGNLGAGALADANNAWWSVSAWQGRDPMRAFVTSEPHQSITGRLDHYCDEATLDSPSPGDDTLRGSQPRLARRRAGLWCRRDVRAEEATMTPTTNNRAAAFPGGD